MKINDWFNNGRDYNEGVSLYASLKTHSANLLRLFLRKESKPNAEKLKYELSKFRKIDNSKIKAASISKNNQKVNLEVDFKSLGNNANAQTNPNPKHLGFYRLNQLHPDLHALSMKQRNDYQKANMQHLKLLRCHKDEEAKALKLCIEIEDLFDAIENAQKVLRHYVDHKVVLNITPRTYSEYTGGQLADARRNKRTSVSKYKKKVEKLKAELGQKFSKADQTKKEVEFQKAENKLLQHEMELQELNELINKK